ncbi:hypothetical protein [Sansalvadorimonas verongulae]|uniref:hypothetical protein n=1 Tax=Sansalvadorimonas verongulae TaxID=2172824 RepID=UPI0012BB519E|nr:hypothetical protein [Sansalvadorimonas verongulae]MTI13142.1 hypothetical protein [Sansalvadorimonas verongulae]
MDIRTSSSQQPPASQGSSQAAVEPASLQVAQEETSGVRVAPTTVSSEHSKNQQPPGYQAPQESVQEQPIETRTICPSQAEATGPSEDLLMQKRTALIASTLKFIARHQNQKGFPLITGAFAEYCTAPPKAKAVPLKQLSPCPEITLVFPNLAMYRAVAGELETLGGDDVLCASGLDILGNATFPYYHKGSCCFTAKAVVLHEHQLNLTSQRRLVKLPDSEVQLYSSSMAIHIHLWNQLHHDSMTPAMLKAIAHDLNSLQRIENEDISVYTMLQSRYLNMFYLMHPPTVPLDIASPPEAIQLAPAPTQEEPALQPRLSTTPMFCDNILSLQQDRDFSQELGFSAIKDLFPEKSEGDFSSRPVMEQRPGSKLKAKAKEARAARKSGGRGKFNTQSRAVRLGAPTGVDLDEDGMMALVRSVAIVTKGDEKKDILKDLLPSHTIQQLIFFVETEAVQKRILHHFPNCPYLGKAACDYTVKPKDDFSFTYATLATDISKLIPVILENIHPDLTFEDAHTLHALVSALLLKYVAYMSDETSRNTLNTLLETVAHFTREQCQQLTQPGAAADQRILQVLPLTLVYVLASPELKQCKLSPDTQEKLVDTLATTLEAAQMSGQYDIAAGIISLLPTVKSWAMPDDSPALKHLSAQIHQFFGLLHAFITEGYDSTREQKYAAKIIAHLKGEVSKLPATWVKPGHRQLNHIAKAYEQAQTLIRQEIEDSLILEKELRKEARERAQEQARIKISLEQARAAKLHKAQMAARKSQDTTDESDALYTVETSPLQTTSATVLTEEKQDWEKEKEKAEAAYKEGKTDKARKLRRRAIEKAGGKMNEAHVLTDCGYAQLSTVRDTITLISTLATSCNLLMCKLEGIHNEAKACFAKGFPSREEAKSWLTVRNFPSEARVTSLARNFPDKDTLAHASQTLNAVIQQYQLAVEAMADCPEEDVQSSGDFLLHLMESDLKHLFKLKEQIRHCNDNLACAMELRTKVMAKVGLYGRDAPVQSKGRSESGAVRVQSSYRSAQKDFKDRASAIGAVFLAHHGSDPLQVLLRSIDALKEEKGLKS